MKKQCLYTQNYNSVCTLDLLESLCLKQERGYLSWSHFQVGNTVQGLIQHECSFSKDMRKSSSGKGFGISLKASFLSLGFKGRSVLVGLADAMTLWITVCTSKRNAACQYKEEWWNKEQELLHKNLSNLRYICGFLRSFCTSSNDIKSISTFILVNTQNKNLFMQVHNNGMEKQILLFLLKSSWVGEGAWENLQIQIFADSWALLFASTWSFQWCIVDRIVQFCWHFCIFPLCSERRGR